MTATCVSVDECFAKQFNVDNNHKQTTLRWSNEFAPHSPKKKKKERNEPSRQWVLALVRPFPKSFSVFLFFYLKSHDKTWLTSIYQANSIWTITITPLLDQFLCTHSIDVFDHLYRKCTFIYETHLQHDIWLGFVWIFSFQKQREN